MNITIHPRHLKGRLNAIPSKSYAHRMLILAAFAQGPTQLHCPDTNKDIEATAACLRALGAEILRTDSGYSVFPARNIPRQAVLPCGESGSTLRFLLPVVGALGVDGVFILEGRLPQRPLSPLWEEMERMGCVLTRPSADTLRCQGKLRRGHYTIDGGVSSQFITGLLLALNLLDGESTLDITGSIQSRPYLDITNETLTLFGCDPAHPGKLGLRSPGFLRVEGDWSNAAFFLGANALGCHVDLTGLNQTSVQGDRAVVRILEQMHTQAPTVSAGDIPDLVPILSVAAAANHGAIFTDIQRLRLKESDRVASVVAMLTALGIRAEADEATLRVQPGSFTGGTVESQNDHRIAMAAAIAATTASGKVTVLGAECVSKSYPGFWEDYSNLGGYYELDLR